MDVNAVCLTVAAAGQRNSKAVAGPGCKNCFAGAAGVEHSSEAAAKHSGARNIKTQQKPGVCTKCEVFPICCEHLVAIPEPSLNSGKMHNS